MYIFGFEFNHKSDHLEKFQRNKQKIVNVGLLDKGVISIFNPTGMLYSNCLTTPVMNVLQLLLVVYEWMQGQKM